jgi:hypothetical protein
MNRAKLLYVSLLLACAGCKERGVADVNTGSLVAYARIVGSTLPDTANMVRIENGEGKVDSAATNGHGLATFTHLRPGPYTITARHGPYAHKVTIVRGSTVVDTLGTLPP